jgi:peptidoglycan/LPS O-acetylase OafA/YrhL
MKIDAVSGAKVETDWIPAIDGLRATAILAVLVHHSNTALFTNWGLGNVGVAIFFSISGFLAYFVLWKDERKLGKIDYNYFLLRRVLRIWPAYLAIIAIAYFLASSAQRAAANEIPLFTFTINWHQAALMMPQLGTLGVLWSIAVEEQFYVLAPFMYLALRSRHWLAFSIAIFALSNFGRAVYMLYFGPPTLAGLYYVSYSYADIFLGGAIAAKWYTEGRIIISKRTQWLIFATSAVVIIATLRLWGPIVWPLGSDIWPRYNPWTLLPYALLSVAGPMLLVSVAAPHSTAFNSFLSSWTMRRIGALSFSLYLVHVLIITALRDSFALPVGGLRYDLWFAALCIPVAMALYYGVELRFLKIKKRMKSAPRVWPAVLIWSLLAIGMVRFFLIT